MENKLTVNIEVTPEELEVIRYALNMYADERQQAANDLRDSEINKTLKNQRQLTANYVRELAGRL